MFLPIYLVLVLVMSLITFIFYAVDKRKAKKGAWRIPEATLLLLSFFFGALGGYLGMITLHHKTKHWYFQVVNIFSLAIHIVIAVILAKGVQ